MKQSTTAYISLGSNQGNKFLNIQNAVFLLNERIGPVTSISNIYLSPSWGFESHDFLNACIALETTKEAIAVLEGILKIEIELGRERKLEKSYAARAIDIDIIYFGTDCIETEKLIVPHPHMESRQFVLRPLVDIAPQFYNPKLNKDTRNLLQECKDKGVLKKTNAKLHKTKTALFTQLQFIAIEGNIGAGKTTLAKKIAEDFNAKLVLERFADNPFLPKFYEDQSRYAFPLEMSFLAERYQQFTDDTSQFDLFKNFMVSDYDIFKSLIFAKITLQEDEYNLYRKVFDFMYKEVKKPGLYIYLYQNTERLLENIKKRGRAYEQQIKSDYLEQINRGYLDFIKNSPENNSLIIDVSELDFVKSITDYDSIVDKIKNFAISQFV